MPAQSPLSTNAILTLFLNQCKSEVSYSPRIVSWMLSVYGGGLSTVATARLSFAYMSCRWATNLGGGNTQNGRDSQAKRLGIKLGNGRRSRGHATSP